MSSLKLFSCAKLNLFFAILAKRKDQFHEIASLMQAIDLCDELEFTLSEQDELISSCSSISNTDNLVFKALNLFREYTQKKFFVKIYLEKKIPLGAGLGGGSSNAATALWALNQLTDYPLSQEEMLLLGSQIGSDVNFFLSNGTAYSTSRGEVIQNLPSLPQEDLYVIKPHFSLATPQVYAKVNLKEIDPREPPHKILDQFYANKPCYFNDLEKAAFQIEPSMVSLKKRLLDVGFRTVTMTGSGSAFFCMPRIKKEKELFNSIPHLSVYPVSFIQRKSNSWYDPKK